MPWTTGVISSTSQAEIPVDSAAMASAILRAAARETKMMDQPIFLENSWTGRHALLQTDHNIDADSAQQDAGGAHIVQHRTDNKGLGHEGGEQQQDDHGHKEDRR